jgi:uncharacterized repeat protein (TIGR01451 family)
MIKKILSGLCLLLLFALPVRAAEKGGIELTSTAEVEVSVVNDRGVAELKRVPAAEANVVPGDPVIFTNHYSNMGEPAEQVIIANPLPENMVYVAGTAEGAGAVIEFSVDGGKSYGPPEELKVQGNNGRERMAEAADYTNIRWTIGSIGKGESGSVSFQAKVK